MIGLLSDVIRVCALIGALSVLQEVSTQNPYAGIQMYPFGPLYGPGFPPPYLNDFNRMRDFQPYYRSPFLNQGRHFQSYRTRYPHRSFDGRGLVFQQRVTRPVNTIQRGPVQVSSSRHQQRKQLTQAQLHHAQKKRVSAIDTGVFPAVHQHPKVQRHFHKNAKKRAKFKAIAKAKSFNGILKGTALAY